jgi:transcriptional regulator with XRE-family HTH domain
MEQKPVKLVQKNGALRQARLRRRWTQRRLADELGVAEETVRAWERGTRYPSLELQERLSKLGIELTAVPGMTEASTPAVEPPPPSSLVKVVPFSPPPGKIMLARGDKNRLSMLKRVEMRWISILKHSLYMRALILLSLQEQPAAIQNPWSEVVQETLQPAGSHFAGSHISEVYDDADGELLILGEPGAGKTTLLLELTRTLIERARRDEQQPLPIVFNLSEWNRHQPLQNWLVEELAHKYQVPRKLGQTWIETEQLLPLLDGLDEVSPREREGCIEAINDYREVYGLVPMVVCCRSGDYFAQSARLLLNRAVEVQPLTGQQIDEYIEQSSAGSNLAALHQALRDDAELQEVASTPLMLNTLMIAYHGLQHVLTGGSPAMRRHLIFAKYVERTFERRSVKGVSIEQMKQYLGWLAQQMSQRNQTEFYVERLQPDWLDDQTQQSYRNAVFRVFCLIQSVLAAALFAWLRGGSRGKVGGIGFGLFGWLGSGPGNRVLGWMAPGVGGGLAGGGTVGLIFILVASLIVQVIGGASPAQQRWSWVRFWHIFVRGLWDGFKAAVIIGAFSGFLFGVTGGLSRGISYATVFGLFSWLLVGLQSGLAARSVRRGSSSKVPVRSIWDRLVDGLLTGGAAWLTFGFVEEMLLNDLREAVVYGSVIGVAYGLTYSLGGIVNQLQVLDTEIRPSEVVGWSWGSINLLGNLQQGILTGLAIFVCIVVVFGGASSVFLGPHYGFAYAAVMAAIVSVAFGVAGSLTGILNSGWQSNLLLEQLLLRPNEGIRRSASNSLFAASFGLIGGLASGLASGLAFGVIGGLAGWPVLASGFTVVFVIIFVVYFALLRGGFSCMKHYILRWFLWRSRSMPWQYIQFLDDAAEHILLRKIGGGYIFAHRLLMEYFASLNSLEDDV